MEKLLLRVNEAAELTGLGRSKCYELIQSGEWPSIKIGRCLRIPAAGLRDWVQQEAERALGDAQDRQA